MKKISLFEPNITNSEKKTVIKSLNTNQISTYGYFNNLLEIEIKKISGARYNLALSSGSASLYVALKSLGIKSNEIVITQSYTFAATTNAILLNNSIPLLVDISKNNLNIDFEFLKEFYHKKTKKKITCICFVFTLGIIPDLKKINFFKKKYNLKIIFDAACALGTKYENKNLTNFCDVAVYSLNGNKNFTSGAGGIFSSNKKRIYNYARQYSNNGKSNNSYDYKMIGFNFRMSSFNASLGLGQIKRYKNIIKQKNKIKSLYAKNLQPVKLYNTNFKWGNYLPWINFLLIKEKNRNIMINLLKKKKIFISKFWLPLHIQSVKKNFILTKFQNTNYIFKRILILPSSTFLKKKDIVRICKTIKKISNES